jgi:dTDP-4-amino-4,6-dideoxygalactose transaminase
MSKNNITRRTFLTTASVGTISAIATAKFGSYGNITKNASTLAINGGQPVRTKKWYDWPIWDRSAEDEILEVLRRGNWFRGRGKKVDEFEKKYAELIGAKSCCATASGTTALLVALHVLGIDAGDEVLVSPYTFIATYNVVFLTKALPVFVDTDIETFTMNPNKIEKRITERTKAILPVHILGLPCDMDRINAIAKKHNLVVIEDACQAWLAEYRGKKCGTMGDLGCFSFQNSKNLPSGEGGAVTSMDETLIDKCQSFHNVGRYVGSVKGNGPNAFRGTNYRMQEFQAVILMSQMKRIIKDAEIRHENATYLTSRIKDIPGIIPFKLADGATKSAYHLYPFRYKKELFSGVPRSKFLKALDAEGIPSSGGYGPQYKHGLIKEALNSRGFQRLFSKERIKRYWEENNYPDNDQLCEEAVWFTQNMLLGPKKDMDDIADAILKIYENRDKLA